LLAALFFVLANGFFVAAEFAIARVRPTALEAKARAGDRQAARAFAITRQLDAYLTATQLGITLASLALGWIGEPAVASLLRTPLAALGLSEIAIHGVAVAVSFTFLSLLHIVIGEVAPKMLAILKPELVARYTSLPLTVFFVSTYPVLRVLNSLSSRLLRLGGIKDFHEASAKLSDEELRLIVQASYTDDDAHQRVKRDLLERVLRATDRPVRALMVPRVDMYTLSLEASAEQWIEQMRRSGFSRYPVTGYVYVKDLLLNQALPKGGLRALKRDVLFVPDSSPVGDLLAQFQRSRIPLAIVVDEYGGTSGLVTLEDVVEELVGDIQDELDAEPPAIQTREDGTVIVDGALPLGDLPQDILVED
jgi:CBS domain containing-hemolysin-like protein